MEFGATTTEQHDAGDAGERRATLRERFADWPQKGGFKDEHGEPLPQAHDLEGHGLNPHDPKLREEDVPLTIEHGRPILAQMSQGPAVLELARRLERLGYRTSIGDGNNPYGVYDDKVHAAVLRFRADAGITEAPTDVFGGDTDDGRQTANRHVGAVTWEALIRASDDPQRHGF